MIVADGFEEAFIGVVHRFGVYKPIAAYDREMCIEILMRDGCSRDGAEEYFEYNVIGAWVGAQTPLFIERQTLEEAEDRYEHQE